jgi:branched-chain amino acid transport system permease protein
MNYIFHILTMMSLYIILGLSLNLTVGYGGMLSLCHAAFYGLGAYASSLLIMNAGWPFLPSFAVAVIIVGIIAYLISIPSIRLHGDFFVLATIGFQVIVFSILYNWTNLTKGPYGIPGVPRPSFGSHKIISTPGFFVFAFVLAALVWFISYRLTKFPFGRSLEAVRDDEIAALSLGKNVVRFKRLAFCISGSLAAISGVLYASYISYIDPTCFTLDESIFILCVVIIGGAGNLRGPISGAVVLVLLPELLRFVQIPDAIAANMRQIIFGLILVLMMRFRPQGIMGKYTFN